MPYFQVMLHGADVLIPDENPENAIVGFYTTRIVRAANEEAAELAACAMVQAQWLEPEYKSNNIGGPPQLKIESVQRSSFIAWLRFRNTGHTFYGPGDAAA
ncbi:hypothetical protein J7U46_20925 [Pelomonas sp. V22]|uniref:hypothetical protein n=1 Tax=Pelomonas sp. V22 TaxID=2822139 RepID=UPI0024A8CADC|nr:hypothetical protein [Pelomonas sp. V22]MDI4635540.1 hypothetical protein [Pelomonas sp. V22]